MPIEKLPLDIWEQFEESTLPYAVVPSNIRQSLSINLCVPLVQVFFLDRNDNLDSSLLLVLQNGQIAGQIITKNNAYIFERATENDQQNYIANMEIIDYITPIAQSKKIIDDYLIKENEDTAELRRVALLLEKASLTSSNDPAMYQFVKTTAGRTTEDLNSLRASINEQDTQLKTAKKTLLKKLREKKLNQFRIEFRQLLETNLNEEEKNKKNFLGEEITKLEQLVQKS